MLPSSLRILVCTQPQDMRRSFDSLALVTQQLLGENPQSGALYVFMGKRPTRIKILWWEKNGFCILQKRLHRALFRLPEGVSGTNSIRIDSASLAHLLAGVESDLKHRDIKFDA